MMIFLEPYSQVRLYNINDPTNLNLSDGDHNVFLTQIALIKKILLVLTCYEIPQMSQYRQEENRHTGLIFISSLTES